MLDQSRVHSETLSQIQNGLLTEFLFLLYHHHHYHKGKKIKEAREIVQQLRAVLPKDMRSDPILNLAPGDQKPLVSRHLYLYVDRQTDRYIHTHTQL